MPLIVAHLLACAGPLQQPQGQRSVFYTVPEPPTPEQVMREGGGILKSEK